MADTQPGIWMGRRHVAENEDRRVNARCCRRTTAARTSGMSSGTRQEGRQAQPPAEDSPKVDEKAYKAALDRIPTPKKGYDPWGQVRPSDPAKTDGPKSGK